MHVPEVQHTCKMHAESLLTSQGVVGFGFKKLIV